MGGTRIFVFQLKEIIRTAVIAVIGIALIIALAYFFLPRDKPSEPSVQASLYIPGTYTAQILLGDTPVDVDVTVSQSEILAIELKNMAETQEVFFPLVQPTMKYLTGEIIKTQSLDVEVSTESSFTGKVILDAVKEALDKASPAA